jgi:hypothetical protein
VRLWLLSADTDGKTQLQRLQQKAVVMVVAAGVNAGLRLIERKNRKLFVCLLFVPVTLVFSQPSQRSCRAELSRRQRALNIHAVASLLPCRTAPPCCEQGMHACAGMKEAHAVRYAVLDNKPDKADRKARPRSVQQKTGGYFMLDLPGAVAVLQSGRVCGCRRSCLSMQCVLCTHVYGESCSKRPQSMQQGTARYFMANAFFIEDLASRGAVLSPSGGCRRWKGDSTGTLCYPQRQRHKEQAEGEEEDIGPHSQEQWRAVG